MTYFSNFPADGEIVHIGDVSLKIRSPRRPEYVPVKYSKFCHAIIHHSPFEDVSSVHSHLVGLVLAQGWLKCKI